jgi:hypothetical protein
MWSGADGDRVLRDTLEAPQIDGQRRGVGYQQSRKYIDASQLMIEGGSCEA